MWNHLKTLTSKTNKNLSVSTSIRKKKDTLLIVLYSNNVHIEDFINPNYQLLESAEEIAISCVYSIRNGI